MSSVPRKYNRSPEEAVELPAVFLRETSNTQMTEHNLRVSLVCPQPVAKVGQLDQLIEAPCSPIRDPAGQLPGELIDSQMGPTNGPGHGRGSVHIPSHGDSRTDRLPVVLGTPQERVQAPQHARRDEWRYAPPFVRVVRILPDPGDQCYHFLGR